MNFKNLTLYHILPFLIAIIFCYLSITTASYYLKSKYNKSDLSNGEQEVKKLTPKESGIYVNFDEGEVAEEALISSLISKNQISLFGSSELTSSDFASFYFLPDYVGIPTTAFGHAYHQDLSILIELIANKDYLENSKVAIILSPGWFESGTNSKAFLEFATKNFMQNISADESINEKYKTRIGEYIHNHKVDFSFLTPNMIVLEDIYLFQSKSYINQLESIIRKKLYITEIGKSYDAYEISNNSIIQQSISFDFDSAINVLRKESLQKSKNNNLYVYDDYYAKSIIDDNGEEKRGAVQINLEGNKELQDLLLVISLLKETNANCSFIMQPLNPYFYTNLSDYDPLMDTITMILEKEDIPFLNLFASNKDDYDKGVLKDVMHFSDYGWMKVNKFLDSLYHE